MTPSITPFLTPLPTGSIKKDLLIRPSDFPAMASAGGTKYFPWITSIIPCMPGLSYRKSRSLQLFRKISRLFWPAAELYCCLPVVCPVFWSINTHTSLRMCPKQPFPIVTLKMRSMSLFAWVKVKPWNSNPLCAKI